MTHNARPARHERHPMTACAIAWALLGTLGLTACSLQRNTVNPQTVRDLATRYTAAWCSQDPTRVASFFASDGSLKINDAAPAVGRAEIAAAARGFMTAFPDLVVRMDDLTTAGSQAVYRWTLSGTNSGPGGTGKSIRISGYEEWTIGADGLVERSLGHFDGSDYDRQLREGPPAGR